MTKKKFFVLVMLIFMIAIAGVAYMVDKMNDIQVTIVKEMENGETVEVSEAAEQAARQEAAQAEAEAAVLEEMEAEPEIAELYGQVTEITDEYVMILTEGLGDVKVMLTEDTVIEGMEAIEIGQTAKVLYTGMMTRSLPPQITALLIGVYTVSGEVTAAGEGTVTITGENGEVILTLPEGAAAPAVGEAVTAYTTGVSTMSIPPQMNAVVIETVDSVG